MKFFGKRRKSIQEVPTEGNLQLRQENSQRIHAGLVVLGHELQASLNTVREARQALAAGNGDAAREMQDLLEGQRPRHALLVSDLEERQRQNLESY